jgi:hypothetical protein
MGQLVRWFFEQYGQIIESVGIIASLCFAALAYRADMRTRKADILIRITEGHRQIWTFYEQTPELSRIFNSSVDVKATPPTAKELRFVQFVINHIVITFKSHKMGIYRQPEALEADIRDFFAWPISKETWKRVRRYQDADVIEFFEQAIKASNKKA